MILDIAKFHRTCPMHPEHKCWFVTQGPLGFYLDDCCPFGCSSSSGNAGMISNASMDIWNAEKVGPTLKYEDDCSIFRFPSSSLLLEDGSTQHTYEYDRPEALRRIEPLGIPWHTSKGSDFNETFVYIGFRWSIESRHVSLPEPKRLKFLARVIAFISSFSGHPCQILDVMKIHGSLCHISFVYPEGRCHLASLSNMTAAFKGNTYTFRYPPPSVLTDLEWWKTTLSKQGITRRLVSKGPPIDISAYVNASTNWGIGLLFRGKWKAWRLIDGWKSDQRSIVWLEAIAMEFLVYILEEAGFRDCHLTVRGDNQGVIGSYAKGRCSNFEVNSCIRRTNPVLSSSNIALNIVYIASDDNPADPISRGIVGSDEDRLISSLVIPEELLPYLLNV